PRGSGRVLKFLVHSDYTCADLQWIFLGAQVVKETNLRIFCAGRLLNDGNELGQYLARDGSIVSIERDCDTPLHFTQEVSVLFPDGKRRDIRAGPTVTFWQLALQLEGRTGEDAQSMSLYCGSNLLNPHLTLEQCGIGPDSTIRVAICQSNNT
ncbi:MAG: hypothetical protein KDK78_10540, partial [Chlamydiia bacterium]|nr:hypothetical protein [Chlamydiia bacterium]